MKQREVQDAKNIRWVCLQALADVEGHTAEVAAVLVESDAGTVPVVCTPSGGEQTMRVELPKGWEESVSDDELLAAIMAARAT
jgi:hypothetical protein